MTFIISLVGILSMATFGVVLIVLLWGVLSLKTAWDTRWS